MKYPVLDWWLALAVCVPSVVLSTATSPETNVKNWIFVPDENGNPYKVYLDNLTACGDTRNKPIVIPVKLYSRDNRFRGSSNTTTFFFFKETLFFKENSTLNLIDQFDAQLDTKMLVHGWRTTADEEGVESLRKAYDVRGKFNIFAIDWRERASSWTYIGAADETDEVGRAVAELMTLLIKHKSANSTRIHLIGHSLGAHVMGYAGYHFKKNTKKLVGRITGLDPASQCYENPKLCSGRRPLENNDAKFVDVIHTDTKGRWTHYGYKNPIGDVDFYPNYQETEQPGCGRSRVRPDMRKWLMEYWVHFKDSSLSRSSSSGGHSRAYKYYAESINSKSGFYSARCSDLEAAFAGKCSGDQILMGDRVPVEARGIYYLKTNAKSPFAKGKHK